MYEFLFEYIAIFHKEFLPEGNHHCKQPCLRIKYCFLSSTSLLGITNCATKLNAYWLHLKCLFSIPDWLTLILITANRRSSGDKNHAVAGESGKKNLESPMYFSIYVCVERISCYQNKTEVINVIIPVIIISLSIMLAI